MQDTDTLNEKQLDLPKPSKLLTNDGREVLGLFPPEGIFLTGIENSDPWVDGVRRDQFKEAYDFYTHYPIRLRNIHSLGISWLRFGPSYSQTHRGPEEFDFLFCDNVLALCGQLDMRVIADLLHFGLPRWIHEDSPTEPFFQNPNFPKQFALYAEQFAKRYPKIKYYTLINEPYITALFSAKIGIWNEQLKSSWDDDCAFLKAGKHIAKAAILARQAIEEVWLKEKREGYPVFVQNESFEIATSVHASRQPEVERFNIRRFIVLDLILGKKDEKVKEYALKQGLTSEEYEWFMKNGKSTHTVLGIDHYPTCVHIYEDKNTIHCDFSHPYQLYTLITEYWDRYKLPLLHTETNGWPSYAEKICQETFDVISQLRHAGYPILGMAWFGDEYQVGWHHNLIGPKSFEETMVGLFYKGNVQPVGALFKALAMRGFPPIID